MEAARRSICVDEAPQPIADAHRRWQGSRSPAALIELFRRTLQGESFAPVAQALAITQPRVPGQVQAIAVALPTNRGQSNGFAGSPVLMVYPIFAMTLCLLPPQGR
jgi:hypothetical protein